MVAILIALSRILLTVASDTENSIELEAILPPHVNLYENITEETNLSDDTLEVGDPLSPDDFAKGANLTEEDMTAPENNTILQASRYFEGDIVFTNLRTGRNAIKDSRSKWLGGRIPYAISRDFVQHDRSVIARAFQEFQDKTCIRFTPRHEEQDFIYIRTGDGCHSLIGRNGGKQPLTLGPNCVFVGVVIHELMHAVGFWHEHSRADRDHYVTVLWDNINPTMKYNFAKFTLKEIQHLGEQYDYNSIMHYERNAFALHPSLNTIIPKRKGVKLEHRSEFSDCDLRKINKLYRCDTDPSDIKPQEESNCQDRESKCNVWAKEGECEKNPKWMLQYCQKSCKVCAKEPNGCVDQSGYCSYWADKGECTKNPRYMLPICPASCKQCRRASANACQDKKTTKCPQWASEGHCKNHRDYMNTYCQKSCNACG